MEAQLGKKKLEVARSKGEAMRMEILDKAIRCLAENGVAGTSFDVVAAMLKTRRSHIAYYYSDREDLIKDCIRSVIQSGRDISTEAIGIPRSTEEGLQRYISGTYLWLGQNSYYPQVWLLMIYMASIRKDFEEFYFETRRIATQRVASLLAIDSQIGSWTPSKISGLADEIQALITGFLVQAISSGGDEKPKDFEKKTIKAVLSRLRHEHTK